MELPIIPKFDEKLTSLQDQKLVDRIRILDIDGTYLVSVWIMERETKAFTHFQEIAFDSLWEAEDYLRDELGVDLPGDEQEKEWIDYDAD